MIQLKKIAFEKAGIIKEEVPVIFDGSRAEGDGSDTAPGGENARTLQKNLEKCVRNP